MPSHPQDSARYDLPEGGLLKPHILVTGGAGYIGSHVCKSLHEAGYTPVVYDNLSSGHLRAVQWGPFIEGDLHDTLALKKTFEKFSPLAVIHMAASINVRESIVNPRLYYHNNVGGTLSLLQAMVESGVSCIVFSSTAAVYGNPHYTPMDEKHALAPLNAYGKSKRVIEEMLEDFSHAHGLRFAALRYFNACGADLEGKIGEAHDPETHLIPSIILSLLHQGEPLHVYGDNYDTPDGTAIRDYIHVVDLAKAHVKAVEHLLSGKENLKLNLGTGQGYSVKQIIDAVASFTSHPVPYEVRPRLAHDSPSLVADSRKAQEILDWSPQHSDLPTIISTAWQWHEKNAKCEMLNAKR